ncbi:hypothetical protein GCM10020331_028330 [Ectobacillus funiculus]
MLTYDSMACVSTSRPVDAVNALSFVINVYGSIIAISGTNVFFEIIVIFSYAENL